jgi:hypothetical protein
VVITQAARRTLRHAALHEQLQADQRRRRPRRALQVLVHALVRAHDVVAPRVVLAVHLLRAPPPRAALSARYSARNSARPAAPHSCLL